MGNNNNKKTETGVVVKQAYLPTTSQGFLRTYSLKAVRTELKKVNSVALAIGAKTPSIGTIRRQYGEVFIEAYLKIWLINLNETINARRQLKEHQIDETAELIVQEYYNLTIADINLIFKNAKLGKYGELYETISINKILTWFSDYFNERCEVASSNSRRVADRQKYQDEQYFRGTRGSNKEEAFNEFRKNYTIKKMQDNGN